MSVRSRRWARVALALAALAAVGIAARQPILRAAGRLLVVDEPMEAADAIVVPPWAGEEGALEAADLVHGGIASLVAVLHAPATPAQQELARRDVRHQDEAADLIELLRSLRVANVEMIPSPAGGTESEGEVLGSWCDQRRLRAIVVVSAPDHSRRLRRVLRRSVPRSTRVAIRSARHSSFDPDRWWETRDGLRIGIVELEKLLLDVLRHPLS